MCLSVSVQKLVHFTQQPDLYQFVIFTVLPLCTYISDDSEFLYVGGLRVQQLPYRLLLVELSPCQCLHTNTDHAIKYNIYIYFQIRLNYYSIISILFGTVEVNQTFNGFQ